MGRDDEYSISRQQMMARILVALGGTVAEELIYGRDGVTSGATDDLRQATEMARHMVMQCGLSEAVGPLYVADEKSLSETMKQAVDEGEAGGGGSGQVPGVMLHTFLAMPRSAPGDRLAGVWASCSSKWIRHSCWLLWQRTLFCSISSCVAEPAPTRSLFVPASPTPSAAALSFLPPC